ncbi:MAG: hypothetical protein QMC85_07540 [Methanocellales archaeon]|nr:hypothetical protein [Methanocellales archaeon]
MPEKIELKRIGRDEFLLKIEDYEIMLIREELKQLRDILEELEE